MTLGGLGIWWIYDLAREAQCGEKRPVVKPTARWLVDSQPAACRFQVRIGSSPVGTAASFKALFMEGLSMVAIGGIN